MPDATEPMTMIEPPFELHAARRLPRTKKALSSVTLIDLKIIGDRGFLDRPLMDKTGGVDKDDSSLPKRLK